MVTKQFSIPQPILPNDPDEWFAIKYRRIQPIIGSWLTIPNVLTNTFSLDLDFNSVYEIEALHHCPDGSDSVSVSTTFNTSTNNPLIYVCMIETPVSDTCANTSGSCRNCYIQKSYKLRFFSNSNGTTPYNLVNNLILNFQESINGVLQPPTQITATAGDSEVNLWTKTTYQETCVNGISQSTVTITSLLDGQFEEFPYRVISCVSNTPTITQTSNASTGPGGIRTQIFQIGSDILPGNKFQVGVYSVVKTVVAVVGDTPTSIASKLVNLINSTTSSQWNAFNSAPTNQAGFPPQL
jgi:hypothetical protein